MSRVEDAALRVLGFLETRAEMLGIDPDHISELHNGDPKEVVLTVTDLMTLVEAISAEASPSASMPSNELPYADIALLAKLGSIAVHVEELWSYQPPRSSTADVLAIQMLLQDPAITGWMAEMTAIGLLPIKRRRLDQDEEDRRTLDHERATPLTREEEEDLWAERDGVGWAYHPADKVIPIRLPDRFRSGDECPLCPGTIGGGHMPGCLIGGHAQ